VLNVTFFGVCATATAARERSRYGTNTACVALEVPRRDPLLCDLGTGAGAWARALDPGARPRASVLLTDLRPDHVSGLPLVDSAELEVFGPPAGRRALGEIPYTGLEEEELVVGDAKVTVRSLPHDGPANGYRIAWEGVDVAYVGAFRARGSPDTVDDRVLELADGVDLLVHAAGGDADVDRALFVAREAGARCLALFGHGPVRDDADLDRVLAGARRRAARMGVGEVLAAAEGTTVSFERGGP
jgi:phosphoribosyl 1,2-cyclic phosphodiesterase